MIPFKKQNGGGGGGGDQIKKLRKEKSMKEADPDGFRKAPLQSSHLGLSPAQQKNPSPSKVTNGLPNQMKHTSRSDAIKDKIQVSTDSSSSSRMIKSTNNLETSISSSNHTGSKTVDKEPVRTSGLKPVRSSMKKNSGVGLHPTMNLSRATCSSTFKIARNSESSDLDESNSASKVTLCSYKYCSLHGQKKHEMPLQSGVELPNSSLEADLESLEVNCEKPVMKANVEAVEGCEPSKHETNYDSELVIRSNYDEDGDIYGGLENEKENVTNSASLIPEIPLAELTNRPKERYSYMRKMAAENQENAREFNPRPPRLLPLKPEQEVEVVNLKHQCAEERKTAEEWMVDYALRNTLGRMAPARKRKVALLIAAFESVIQQEQSTTVS